jgi:prepilin-type N-terminal cleavage/methylation domain-containing protein
MIKDLKKGFTLIELLVVVAIIGILASVVLVQLNSARDKGADAAIKANLSGARSQAEISYSDNGYSYASVCANAGVVKAVNAAIKLSNVTPAERCFNNAGAWAVYVELKTKNNENAWCVDSTGTSGQITTSSAKDTDTGVGATFVCPTTTL